MGGAAAVMAVVFLFMAPLRVLPFPMHPTGLGSRWLHKVQRRGKYRKMMAYRAVRLVHDLHPLPLTPLGSHFEKFPNTCFRSKKTCTAKQQTKRSLPTKSP